MIMTELRALLFSICMDLATMICPLGVDVLSIDEKILKVQKKLKYQTTTNIQYMGFGYGGLVLGSSQLCYFPSWLKNQTLLKIVKRVSKIIISLLLK